MSFLGVRIAQRRRVSMCQLSHLRPVPAEPAGRGSYLGCRTDVRGGVWRRHWCCVSGVVRRALRARELLSPWALSSPGVGCERVCAVASARVDAAVSVASSAARILAGDGPAAGVAARTNCPVVLSRGIGPAGEVQRKRRAEVCETEQRSATKTYRRPADQKLSFINHSKCIARICLLFSSRIESLPYSS